MGKFEKRRMQKFPCWNYFYTENSTKMQIRLKKISLVGGTDFGFCIILIILFFFNFVRKNCHCELPVIEYPKSDILKMHHEGKFVKNRCPH